MQYNTYTTTRDTMANLKILAETPIPLAQLKEDLALIRKRDGELNFRAAKAEDYVNHFVGLSASRAGEFAKKMEELNIPRLKPEHIAKITDLLPESVEELKSIMSSYTITVSAENMSLIVEAIKPFLAENKSAVEVQVQRAAEAAAKAAAEAAAKAAAEAEEEKKAAEKTAAGAVEAAEAEKAAAKKAESQSSGAEAEEPRVASAKKA